MEDERHPQVPTGPKSLIIGSKFYWYYHGSWRKTTSLSNLFFKPRWFPETHCLSSLDPGTGSMPPGRRCYLTAIQDITDSVMCGGRQPHIQADNFLDETQNLLSQSMGAWCKIEACVPLLDNDSLWVSLHGFVLHGSTPG